MIPNRRDQFTAQWTLISRRLRTLLGVLQQPLARCTVLEDAVGIAALHGMTDGVEHTLHVQLLLLLNTDRCVGARRCFGGVVRSLHAMLVFHGRVAFTAQVVVIAHRAMITDITLLPTGIARVGVLVGGRRVQFDERDHRGVFGHDVTTRIHSVYHERS